MEQIDNIVILFPQPEDKPEDIAHLALKTLGSMNDVMTKVYEAKP